MELLIIFCLTLVNGLLAMSEAAVIASRKPRLEERAQAGKAGAKQALQLADDPNRFLSTVQIGITLVGVLAGAFGGATVARDLAERFAQVEALKPYANSLGVALVVGITTYLSLIVGELVPKQIAIRQPEIVASRVAPLMAFLSRAAAPLAWFLDRSATLVLWLLNIRQEDEPSVTETEITMMVQEGHRVGIFQRHEREMVEGVFRLDILTAAALMIPRTEMEWLGIKDDAVAWRETALNTNYTWIVVRGETEEDIIGTVRTRDILAAMLLGEIIDLRQMAEKPLFIPETLPAPAILEQLRGRRDKMAIVISEYGSVEGILTLQDVVEAVVGDIGTPEAIQRDDGSWLVDGLMPLEEFKALLRLPELPDEADYNTVAGFVINQLDAIPVVADHFTWAGLRFEVMDMDGNRVDKVLVRREEDDLSDVETML